MKKLLIIGHARHGKDTTAEILNREFGYKYKSSSELAAEIFIFNELKHKYGYNSIIECFEDRINHRAEWYELIKEYNQNDRAKLAKQILEINDCYVGMREREEILECRRQNIFDVIVWVDGSERLPLEPPDSFNITVDLADCIIYNNNSLEEFKNEVYKFAQQIGLKRKT